MRDEEEEEEDSWGLNHICTLQYVSQLIHDTRVVVHQRYDIW